MTDSISLTVTDMVQHLLDNIPSGIASADYIEWPNKKLANEIKNSNWLRVDYANNDTNSAAAGYGYKLTFGILLIEVNVPLNTHANEALSIAEELKQTFQATQLSNTKLQESSVDITGINENWYTVQVKTNYLYEGY